MKPYRLTTEAQADVQGIANYLAVNAGQERAVKVISAIREAFLKIGYRPSLGHFREDVVSNEFKFWSVYKYVIAYRWKEKPIQIIAVVHGARDLPQFIGNRV